MKKKNVKLVACLSLTGFLALCGLPYMNNSNYNIGIMETQAAEITNTWESGNTTVTLDSEGTLTVTAKPDTDGRMGDHNTYPGWYYKVINNLIIEEGVTYIGNNAFKNNDTYTKVTELHLPSSVTKIGNNNFKFEKLKVLTLPNNDVEIGSCFGYPNKSNLIINIPSNFKLNSTIGFGKYTEGTITFNIADGSIYEFFDNNCLISKEDGKVLFMKESGIIPEYATEILTCAIQTFNSSLTIPKNVKIINKEPIVSQPENMYHTVINIKNENVTLVDFDKFKNNFFFNSTSNSKTQIIAVAENSSLYNLLKKEGYSNVGDESLVGPWISGDIELSYRISDNLFLTSEMKPKSKMEDYDTLDNVPWKRVLKEYPNSSINLYNGITKIGANAFPGIKQIQIYYRGNNENEISSIIDIGANAFAGSKVVFQGTKYQDSNLNGIHLGSVGDSAFEGATIIVHLYSGINETHGIYLNGDIGDKAFKDCNIDSSLNNTKMYITKPSINIGKNALDEKLTILYFKLAKNGVKQHTDYISQSNSVKENSDSILVMNTMLDIDNQNEIDWSQYDITLKGTSGALLSNGNIDTLRLNNVTLNNNLLKDTSLTIKNLWYKQSAPNLNAGVTNFYWDYKDAVGSVNIDSVTKIYVHKDSPAETWCKNNSRDYDYITDEMISGKRPIINQFNLLFDKQNPSDLHFDFDLGSGQLGAKSIKNIIINGKRLIKDTDFVISDSTITLKKEIFETLTNDTYQVIINFNNEYTIEDKVKIIVYGEDVILTPDKTVPEQTLYIDKSNLEDAIFTVYCDSIDKLIINNKQLKTEEWELKEKTQLLRNGSTEKPKELIIKKSVLNELKPNEYNVTIVTEGVTLKNLLFLHITGDNINDEPPIILDTIKYEFYKDYPDFIVIPFSFNRASSITEVKIGSNILDSTHYDIVDSTIIINKDYLSTLDIGKYVVSVTFDDNTKRSNAQLIVYEKAADRAAPYLLQSHIIFNGNSINLNFDPGEGDLQTTNVLALVLDDKLILPNGDKVDFNSSNINKLQKAYEDYTNKENEEEVASPSNAKKESNTNNKDNDNIDSEDTNKNNNEEINTNENEAINNDNIDNENTNTNKDETNNNGNQENIDSEDTNINKDETINNEDNESNKEEDKLVKVDVEQVESNSFNLFATLDDYNTVFVTNGTEITLDGAYIESLNLSEGDHLIGAIFDNTEKTTDVKKVILTIPKPDSGDKPIPPDDGDKEEPVNPTPKPDEGNKPTPPDNNNGGGSSSGGSHSGGTSGSNSKPDNSKPSPINPDGSLNPDYKPIVPDTGGKFEGNGDDWTYIKPDGSQAKNEWVGDGKDWYYIDENSKLKYDWALINNEWYMLNREHDGKFGAAKYGWYKENQDGQWYFMNPKDTKMLTGWQKINHKWYYFNVNQEEPTYYGDNQSGWKYDTTKGIRPHGSMYANEITPDGYKTNEKGEWIQ